MTLAGKAFNVIEDAERQEMVGTAPEVLAPLTGADEDAHARPHGGLGDLHVKGLAMQGNFSRNSDARLIGTDAV